VSFSTFVAGIDSDADILSSLLQPSIVEDRHVTVVFNAEKITDWDRILPALKARVSSRFFIAVSDADSVDKSKPVFKYLSSSSKAKLVECGKMADTDFIDWVESRLDISRSAARYLIDLSAGDSEWLLNAMKKLEVLDIFISRSTLDKIRLGSGNKPFKDAFITGDKKAVAERCAAGDLTSFNIDDIISTIMDAFLVNESLRSSSFDRRVLRDKTSMTMTQINQVKPIVRIFDRPTVSRRLTEIMKLETGLRQKNKYAIAALIARW